MLDRDTARPLSAETALPVQLDRGHAPGWRLSRKYLLAAVLFIALAGVAVFSALRIGSGAAPRPRVAKIGQPAPEVNLRILEKGQAGRAVALTGLQGHPVVLNFWATWCPPCREEFPALEKKYREYGGSKGLIVIGIDSQQDLSPKAAQEFTDSVGTTFPIWIDDPAASAEESFLVDALPTTVLIDRGGVIRDIIVGGPITEQYLEKELSKIF